MGGRGGGVGGPGGAGLAGHPRAAERGARHGPGAVARQAAAGRARGRGRPTRRGGCGCCGRRACRRPSWSATGVAADGRGVVVVEDLAGYRQADRRPTPDVLAAAAALAADLHRAGLHHRDLYLNHILVRNGGGSGGVNAEVTAAAHDSPDLDLRVIDAGRVRPLPRWTGQRWVFKDVAQLVYSTPRADRAAVLRAYHAHRPPGRLALAAVAAAGAGGGEGEADRPPRPQAPPPPAGAEPDLRDGPQPPRRAAGRGRPAGRAGDPARRAGPRRGRAVHAGSGRPAGGARGRGGDVLGVVRRRLAGGAARPLAVSGHTRTARYRSFLASWDEARPGCGCDLVHAMLPVVGCDLYHPHAGIAADARHPLANPAASGDGRGRTGAAGVGRRAGRAGALAAGAGDARTALPGVPGRAGRAAVQQRRHRGPPPGDARRANRGPAAAGARPARGTWR